MKRSPELRDLSEEHHYGLVAARSLRLATEAEGPISEAVASFLREWHDGIQPHFRTEEEVLLPQLASVLGADHELIVRTLAEHSQLRLAVQRLPSLMDEELRQLAGQTAELLHDHIRFEERVLFPAVEEQLAGARLQQLGAALKHTRDQQSTSSGSCRTLSNLPIEKPPSRMH